MLRKAFVAVLALGIMPAGLSAPARGFTGTNSTALAARQAALLLAQKKKHHHHHHKTLATIVPVVPQVRVAK
jgi:hypothetical protein